MEILALFVSLLWAVGTAALLLVVVIVLTIHKRRRRLRHLPTPPGARFFTGHAHYFFPKYLKGKLSSDVTLQWYKETGSIFLCWKFATPHVFVADPEAIQKLSTTRIPKSGSWHMRFPFGQRFFGNNLLTIISFEEWKHRRRLFDPSFSTNYLQSLLPQFNKVVQEELVSLLRQCVVQGGGSAVVEMRQAMSDTVLEVLSWVAFGTRFTDNPEYKDIVGDSNLYNLLAIAAEGVNRVGTSWWVQHMGPLYGRKYRKALKAIRDLGTRCVQKRIKALEKNEQVPEDILTQILKLTKVVKGVELEDLVDEFILFYGAGQETTSTLLQHALVAIIQHPDIMQSITAEVDEVLGDRDFVTEEDLSKLTYMQQVLEETLRMWPPAPFLGKQADEDIELCGICIPKRTHLVIPTYVVHRSERHYDNPLKFDPGRFAPGQNRLSPYVYFPFGLGHRSCIGRIFALMESKIVLALLFKHFTFSLPEGFQLQEVIRVTLQTTGEIPCTIKARRKMEH